MYINSQDALAKALEQIARDHSEVKDIPYEELARSLAEPGAVSTPATEEFLRQIAEHREKSKNLVLNYEICAA